MFYHLLESSHGDDSSKWSNIGFVEEITKVESIEVHFTHLIWSSDTEYGHISATVRLDWILVLFFICCSCVPVAGVGSRRLVLLIPDLQAVLFCG